MSVEWWLWGFAVAAFAAIDVFLVNVLVVSRWRELGRRRTLRLALGLTGTMLIVFSLVLGVVFGVSAWWARDSRCSHDRLAGRPVPGVDEIAPAPTPGGPGEPGEPRGPGGIAAIDPALLKPADPPVEARYIPGSLVLAKRLSLSRLAEADGWANALKPATGDRYSFRYPRSERFSLELGTLYDVTFRVGAECPTGVLSCGEVLHVEPALLPPARR